MKRGSVPAERRQPCSRIWLLTISFLITFRITAGEPSRPTTMAVANHCAPATLQEGVASYYADKHHGRMTANGETFDMYALTAAHRKLPFGTKLKVTSLVNNRSVIVRINDRGPYVNGRVIDLSYGAAVELQMLKSGLAEVRLEVVK